MAINFPSSPSTNDSYTYSSKTWTWNGSAWVKSSATETGNTEGNTGEIAYYDVKGSVIKGATGFLYDSTTHGISAFGNATVSGIILKGTTANNFITFADGSTQGTRHDLDFRLNGQPLMPGSSGLETDLPHRHLDLVPSDDILISAALAVSDTARYVFNIGSNIPKLSASNDFTANVNLTSNTWGANKYAGGNLVLAAVASADLATATYMGVTADLINFKVVGADILDLDTDIHAFVGISADAGATFANDINVNTLTIGVGAGDVSTNTALGKDALYSNTDGYKNVAIGYESLVANTGGHWNVASGYQSLYSNIDGDSNVASGYKSLYSNTGGLWNVATGHQSLYDNIDGWGNVASGYRSLFNNTTGNYNVALGYHSLYSNTEGGNNVATGYQALYKNIDGGNNVATGFRSLYKNTTGNYNVASGYYSLYSNTEGNYNSALGNRSLYENTEGDNNSALGYGAGYNGTIGSNNTYLGHNAQPSSAIVSNEIVLGDSNVTLIRSAAGISAGGGIICGSLEVGGYWAGQHEEIIGVNVDNGSQTLNTGIKGHRSIPYNCEIVDWRVTTTDAGTIEWGINYATYANFPTMTAFVIDSSEAPGITVKGMKDESDGDISGTWTPYQLDAGDIIEFEVDSVSSMTNCMIELTIRRIGYNE